MVHEAGFESLDQMFYAMDLNDDKEVNFDEFFGFAWGMLEKYIEK